MIEASHLTYRIGTRCILNDVSVSVRPTEVLAVLGPNGSGKSTLLKCLVGTLKPDAGRVQLDGQPIETYGLADLAARRAVLMQAHAIHFPFTVSEVAMLGRHPHFRGHESTTDRDLVHTALRMTDTWDLRNRLFPSLSGGEQQRVQFARTLAQILDRKGACLFLDEPTSALDLKHQYQVFEHLKVLAGEIDLAIFVIVHDIRLARRYADTVVLMRDGRIQGKGPASDVLTSDRIATVFDIPAALATDL